MCPRKRQKAYRVDKRGSGEARGGEIQVRRAIVPRPQIRSETVQVAHKLDPRRLHAKGAEDEID